MLGRQIEARRHTAYEIVHDLQVFAAAKLAGSLAEQNHGVAGHVKPPADHAVSMLEHADNADDRRRVDGTAVGFVVQADIPAGDWHVEDSFVTAMSAAQIGAADDVPPDVCQPPNDWSYTVIPPVNSSAWALTSGTSRHAVWVNPAGLSV